MFKSPDNAVEMLLKASGERIHGNNFDFEFRCPETTITLFVGNYSGTEKSQQFPLKTDQLVSHLEPLGINSYTTKWDTSDFYQMLFGLPRVGIAGVIEWPVSLSAASFLALGKVAGWTLVRRGRELVVRAPGFRRRDGEERACRIKRLPLVCGA